MRSPWKRFRPLEPGRTYTVLVTDTPPKSISSTRRLFRGASAVKKQLATADGVIGFSLEAKPFAKQYRSLSVWTSEEALGAFARANAHGHLTRDLGPEMAPSTFVRWEIAGEDGRPRWREGVRRLDEAALANTDS